MSNPAISLFIILLLLVLFVGIIGISVWEKYSPTKWVHLPDDATKEGFATENTTCVYFPLKKHKRRDVFSSFKINDFIRDALEIPESIKLYKNLIYTPDASNSTSTTGEYSSAVEELAIYKKYTIEMKPNETKMLDQIYGDLFDTNVVSSLK